MARNTWGSEDNGLLHELMELQLKQIWENETVAQVSFFRGVSFFVFIVKTPLSFPVVNR